MQLVFLSQTSAKIHIITNERLVKLTGTLNSLKFAYNKALNRGLQASSPVREG